MFWEPAFTDPFTFGASRAPRHGPRPRQQTYQPASFDAWGQPPAPTYYRRGPRQQYYYDDDDDDMTHERQEALQRRKQREDALRRQAAATSRREPPFAKQAHDVQPQPAKRDKERMQKAMLLRYKRAARTIQRAVRVYLEKLRAEKLERQTRAAIVIQRYTRGFLARRLYKAIGANMTELNRLRNAIESIAMIEMPAAMKAPFLDKNGKQNKSFLLTEDRINKLVAKVDAIPSEGLEKIRSGRRALIHRSQELLDQLDHHKNNPPTNDVVDEGSPVSSSLPPQQSAQPTLVTIANDLAALADGAVFTTLTHEPSAADSASEQQAETESRLRTILSVLQGLANDPTVSHEHRWKLIGRAEQLLDLLALHYNRPTTVSLGVDAMQAPSQIPPKSDNSNDSNSDDDGFVSISHLETHDDTNQI